MAEVFLPDEEPLRAAGYGAYVHVPVLFGEDEGLSRRRFYRREYNRYLRERSRLEWSPRLGGTADEAARGGRGGGLRYPTRKSLLNYAERLANFDDWLAATRRDWRTVDYTEDIVRGYQADMLSGRWAKGGRPLKTSTVDVRVSEACLFLKWAGERGYRPPFPMITAWVNSGVQSGTNSHGERGRMVESRAGRPSPDAKEALEVPPREKMDAWLAAVKARRGHTKSLMCRFALGAAARKAEVVRLRLGDFPFHDPALGDPDDGTRPWTLIGEKVLLTLRHGTKGKRADPVGAPDRGPERTVRIPLALARDLLAYRDERRLKAALLFKKHEKRLPNRDEDFFFLGEVDGRPVSEDTFYRAWKVKPLPMAGWHPHGARDYWACTTLLEHLEQEARKVSALGLDRMPDQWINEVGGSFISTTIRPQLGHIDVETTLRYLKWITENTALVKYYVGYHEHLDGADG